MNTPSKTGYETTQTQTNTDDSMMLTPFRGRAIEENRLRQAFRMSVTPGLKRRLQTQRSHSSWRSNPNELRLFISDMSESRYSNSGKNLMGQLQMASGENSELQQIIPYSEHDLSKSNIEQSVATPRKNIEDSNPTISSKSDLPTETKGDSNKEYGNATNNDSKNPPKRLSDLIFSQLKVVPREVKIRKLEPLKIQDVGLKPLADVDDNNINNNNNNNNNTGFIFNNDSLPFELPRTPLTVQPIYTDDNILLPMSDNNDNNTVDNAAAPMDIDNVRMENFEEDNSQNTNGYDKDPDIIDHEYERSFTFGQTTPHTDNEEAELLAYLDADKGNSHSSNDTKNNGSETIDTVTKIRHLLIRPDGTFETDFDKIITFLNNNQMIMNDSMPSMNEIFEICCQYLDMSEINEIERVWFNY